MKGWVIMIRFVNSPWLTQSKSMASGQKTRNSKKEGGPEEMGGNNKSNSKWENENGRGKRRVLKRIGK